jgi:hypothetical protein
VLDSADHLVGVGTLGHLVPVAPVNGLHGETTYFRITGVLGDQEVGQPDQAPGRERQAVLGRLGSPTP